MLNTYTTASQTLATGQDLLFRTNKISTNCTITHTEGNPTITLNKPGFYLVSFNGTTTSATAPASAIILQLTNNGVLEPGAIAEDLPAASAPANLAFTTLIRVLPSCCAINNKANLTVRSVGVAADFSNVNLVVTKICDA